MSYNETTYETQAYVNWGYVDYYVDNALEYEDIHEMSTAMKNEIEELVFEKYVDDAGLISDLLIGAISEIDFTDLAAGIFDELEPDDDTLDVEVGPTSSDTIDGMDIIEGIEKYVNEDMLDEYYGATSAIEEIVFDEIVDDINDRLPDDIEFCAHPEDPACWGFWKVENHECDKSYTYGEILDNLSARVSDD